MSGIKMATKFAKYKITDMSVGVSTHVHVSSIITVIITIIIYNKNNNNNNNKDNSNNIIIITTFIIVLIYKNTDFAGLQNQK
jgi:integral membrane sensor domain MASE1